MAHAEPMADPEYVLAVGLYAEPEQALADLRELRAAAALRPVVAGAGLLHRGLTRSVLHQPGGGTVAYTAVTGASAGVVAGVLLGMPLLGAAAGALVGTLVGRRRGRQEFDTLAALLDDAIPVGGTGLLAVVPAESLLLVRRSMSRALRTTGRVLDEGPLTDLAKTLVRGSPVVTESLDRQSGREP